MDEAQQKIVVSVAMLEELVKAMLDELPPDVRKRVQEKAELQAASVARSLERPPSGSDHPNLLNWLREDWWEV